MRKICVLLEKNDELWAKKIIDKHVNDKGFFVIAPTFEGAVLAKSLNIEYFSCEDIAWKINKLAIFKKTKHLVSNIINIYDKNVNPLINNQSILKKYKIFNIHYSHYLYCLNDIAQSYEFTQNIILKFKPKKIFIRDNKVSSKEVFDIVHNTRSLVYAFQSVANLKKIKIINQYNIPEEILEKYKKKILFVLKIIYYLIKIIHSNFIYLIFNLINFFAKLKKYKNIKYNIFINCECGYYFDAITKEIVNLSENNLGVNIKFMSDTPSIDKLYSIIGCNIKLIYNFYPSYFASITTHKINIIEYNQLKKIFKILKNIFFTNKIFLNNNPILKIFIIYLQNEIFYTMPKTIKVLNISENNLIKYKPTIIFNQFDFHPIEKANILPAIKKNIITISSTHGLPRSLWFKEYFASDIFLVSSKKYLTFLKNIFRKNNIYLINDNYYSSLHLNYNKINEKLLWNLNPKKPVCIFCDNSQWIIDNQFINSEFYFLNVVMNIKYKNPNLQIILRVHAGFNAAVIKEYISSFGYKDVYFQQHPNPDFKDIVKAADLVVAQGGSSIIESLNHGVPVIYLTALGYADPFYKGYKNIEIVDNFALLPHKINELLSKKTSRKVIKKESSKFFDEFQSKKKNNSLSNYIISLNKKNNEYLRNISSKNLFNKCDNRIKLSNSNKVY
jgi:hypothetical protein